MKNFRSHFGFTLSLIALLFSLQCGIFINSLISKYEISTKSEYAIVLVSSIPLSTNGLKQNVSEVKSISPISTDMIMSKFQGKISADSLKLLQASLPKFYNVELKFFPNSDELSKIKDKLQKISGIERIEIFKRKHDNIYRVLILIKTISYVFIVLIVVLSVMLMNKQIKIWIFEHKERLEIMTLFGATFFEKSLSLYRMAILDSLIATFVVSVIFLLLPLNYYFSTLIQIINVKVSAIRIPTDFFILLFASWVLSITAVSSVMRQSSKGFIK